MLQHKFCYFKALALFKFFCGLKPFGRIKEDDVFEILQNIEGPTRKKSVWSAP